jgi:hypothetical protein
VTEKAIDNPSSPEHTMPPELIDNYLCWHRGEGRHQDLIRSRMELVVTIASMPVTGDTGFPVIPVATS